MRWETQNFPANIKRTTLGLKVAATPWVTKANYPSLGPWTIKPTDHVVAFTLPRPTEKGMSIVAVEDYIGFDTRLQAVDRGGHAYGSRGSIDLRKGFRIHDYEFLVPEKELIDRYELQVRPFGTVEFKEVPLEAPKP